MPAAPVTPASPAAAAETSLSVEAFAPSPASEHPSSSWDRVCGDIVRSAVDYAIATCSTEGRITSWNPGAQRLTGWEAEAVLGRPLAEVLALDEPPRAGAGQAVIQAPPDRPVGPALHERWQHRRDGTRFWASGEVLPLRDPAGRPEGYLLIVRDRTAARRRVLATEFLARASDIATAGLDDPDALTRIAHGAVPDFADLCAVDLLEAGGVLRRVAAVHAETAREGQVQAMHETFPPYLATQGGIWQLMTTGQPLWLPEVTRPLLESAMESRQHTEALLQLQVCSYLAVPLMAEGEALGLITFATNTPDHRFVQADLAVAVDLARCIGHAVRHTRLIRALREADRAKDVFLATLAHELRNPLAPIRNGLSILHHVPAEPARVEAVTSMMERQAALLARLVDDLLDISRIATGKLEIRREPVDLVQVLASAVEMSRPHIDASQHRLLQDLPPAPAWVLGDAGRLAQVFSNLLNNAAKYTRRGGCIDLLLRVYGREVVVHVRDNGDGIDAPMLRKVFDRYTQLPQSQDRRQGGLGIGLSLVEGLVRLHQGRVEALSAGLGRGSEFIVRLPRLVQPPAPGPEAAGSGVPVNSLGAGPGRSGPSGPSGPLGVSVTSSGAPARAPRTRVLVVDDNADAASSVADLLALAGCEVVTAHEGAGVAAQVQALAPDLVLLDIGLPDRDGYAVAREIRALVGVRQPRLIALTGWGQSEDRQRALAAGFDHHWIKPVDPQQLLDLARSLITTVPETPAAPGAVRDR